MASVEDIKAKIRQNPNGFTLSNDEWALVLDGVTLTGQFNVDTKEEVDPNISGARILPYATAFDTRINGARGLTAYFEEKEYKNLSYNELLYAIQIFDENSDEFEQLYSNIRTSDLGVLFEEFSFNDFDEAIFNEANNLLKGIINLDQ